MPFAARMGDLDAVHCSVPIRASGSPNVLINLRPAVRVAVDFNTPHLLPCGCPPCCCLHAAPVGTGAATVLINGLPATRVGDTVALCTFIATGSPNVLIGGGSARASGLKDKIIDPDTGEVIGSSGTFI